MYLRFLWAVNRVCSSFDPIRRSETQIINLFVPNNQYFLKNILDFHFLANPISMGLLLKSFRYSVWFPLVWTARVSTFSRIWASCVSIFDEKSSSTISSISSPVWLCFILLLNSAEPLSWSKVSSLYHNGFKFFGRFIWEILIMWYRYNSVLNWNIKVYNNIIYFNVLYYNLGRIDKIRS